MMKMLLLVALMLPGWLCYAQTDSTYNIQKEYDQRYGRLSAADITTGVLIDKTITFSNLHRFDGLFDTLATFGLAEQAYLEYYNASVTRNGLQTR